MASKCLRNQKRPALYGASFIILVFMQKSNRAIFDLPVIVFIRQKKKPIAKAIGFLASYAYFDARDGCTRRCSGGYISRILLHFSRHDPAFLLPERNAVRPDFLHAIPTKHRRIVPFLDLLHRCFTGGVQLLVVLDLLDLDDKANLPILPLDNDVTTPLAGFRIGGYARVWTVPRVADTKIRGCRRIS